MCLFMESPGAYTSLLNEAINGHLEDPLPRASECLPQAHFYWNDKYDDLLLKYFYEVKTRATSQQGFKANHNFNDAKLINQAFQVRGCVMEKVKYRCRVFSSTALSSASVCKLLLSHGSSVPACPLSPLVDFHHALRHDYYKSYNHNTPELSDDSIPRVSHTA